MKIKEDFKYDEQDDKILIKKTHDLNPYIKDMEAVRSAGTMSTKSGDTSDYRHVGRIPMVLVTEWCRESGVELTDRAAVQDVIRKKILSGDFDKFRSDWRGRY